MLLSRHFSLWLRRTIPLAVRCPLCGPLHLVSCIQIFSFSFLVCFCGTADAFLFSTFIRYFQVWSAVVDVVEPTSPVCSAYTSFLFFFQEPCRYMRLTTFPTPFGFIGCELQYFKQFRLWFVYLGRGSSVFSISFTHAVFVFFCLSACGAVAAFALFFFPGSLFSCLVCRFRRCKLPCLLLQQKFRFFIDFLCDFWQSSVSLFPLAGSKPCCFLLFWNLPICTTSHTMCG